MTRTINSYGIYVALPEPPFEGVPFLKAISREIDAHLLRGLPAGSCGDLYISGLPMASRDGRFLGQLFATVDRVCPVRSDTQRTLEMELLPPDHPVLHQIRSAGFNRICLIPAAEEDGGLPDSIAAVRSAGIAVVAFEHLFCHPGIAPGRELSRLQAVIDGKADHISLLEKEGDEVGGEDWFDRYEIACALLRRAGYERYEISHFARTGHRSRHVERVFSLGPVIGLGPGAVTFTGSIRQRNTSDTEEYIRSLLDGRPAVDFRQKLTTADIALESISLGIRLAKGLNIGQICQILPQEQGMAIEAAGEALAGAGWLEKVGNRLRLSEKGILFADKIAAELLPE